MALSGHCIQAIVNEIEQYLLQLLSVRLNHRQVRTETIITPDTANLKGRNNQRAYLLNELVKIHGSEVELGATSCIEEPSNNFSQTPNLRLNQGQLSRNDFVARKRFNEQLDVTGNQIKRGSHFVSKSGGQLTSHRKPFQLHLKEFLIQLMQLTVALGEFSRGTLHFRLKLDVEVVNPFNQADALCGSF